jgi:hypothetical protein
MTENNKSSTIDETVTPDRAFSADTALLWSSWREVAETSKRWELHEFIRVTSCSSHHGAQRIERTDIFTLTTAFFSAPARRAFSSSCDHFEHYRAIAQGPILISSMTGERLIGNAPCMADIFVHRDTKQPGRPRTCLLYHSNADVSRGCAQPPARVTASGAQSAGALRHTCVTPVTRALPSGR